MAHTSDIVALGVDVGTTNTKAALVALRGGEVYELATASRPTPDVPGALLATVGVVVRDVVGRSERTTGREVCPAAVGVASMAETGLPLDRDGSPLTDMLGWNGHRAVHQASALARVHGAEEFFAATGVRPSAKVPLATWAWLREHDIRLHRWVGAAGLVVLALTGRHVTDHTLAGRTMAYRVGVAVPLPTTFDRELLDLVGLVPDQLPVVADPERVAGYVRGGPGHPDVDGTPASPGLADRWRAALGLEDVLAPGTPVVVAGHDHAVGSWAAGVRRPGGRADSVGTAEAVLTVLDRPPVPGPVAAAGMSWVRTVSGRHHALLAGSSSAWAMLGWLERQVAPMPLARALDDAADLLTVTDDGASGLLVLPYLAGRQTPSPDPAARVRLVERSAGGRVSDAASPGHLALAVLEGVCLQARWMLEEQGELGQTQRTVALSVLGGAVRGVPAWAEVKRRVMSEPVAWVTAAEPVAMGAAVLAAARAGLTGAPDGVNSAPVLEAEQDHVTGRKRPPDARLASFVRVATARRAPKSQTPTCPQDSNPITGGTA